MATLMLAAPFVVLGILVAALVVQRQIVVRVTSERDRIIRVIDPTGKDTPDQAVVAAQQTVTERDAAKSALTATTRTYRLASARARSADFTHARAVEQRDAAIAGKAQHDIEAHLRSARADADAHARGVRGQEAAAAIARADPGTGSAAGVPKPAHTASRAAVARAAADLDDSRICAANTVVAEGWQRWWSEVAAAPR